MFNTVTSNNERKESFKSECKVINLKYEYEGYNGTEKWAIISELTETELFEKYPDEVEQYVPFVLLSVEQGKAIAEFNRNEDKFKKRRQNNESGFGYDELTETEHSEVAVPDFLEQKENDEYYENREEQKMQLLVQAMASLTEKQYKYLVMRYVEGKSVKEIAAEEGVSHQAIDKHISSAKKKFEKVFEGFFRK